MKCILIYILYLCILCNSLVSHAITLTNLPTLPQLPVNAIHRIFADSEGYIWYGTVDGLCRDDGYKVDVFRSDINSPCLLKDNTIVCIAEDLDGKIWFGTDNGAYILDKKNYKVVSLDSIHLNNKIIDALYTTSDGYIWLVHHGALVKYNKQGERIREYNLLKSGKSMNIKGFCEGRNHDIYVTTGEKQLYYYDSNRDEFLVYEKAESRNNLNMIIQDKHHDYFWISSRKDGNIIRFNPNDKDSIFVYNSIQESLNTKEILVDNLVQDDIYGYLWVITNKSMVVFEPQVNGILRSLDEYNKILPNNCMLSEAIYHENCLWVAAFDRSSFMIDISSRNIQNYILPTLFRRPAIMAVADAGDNLLWIMQERCGLLLYDLSSDRVSYFFDFQDLKKLNLSTGRELAQARCGIWLTKDKSQSIYRVERNGMNLKLGEVIDLQLYLPPTSFVTKIYEDKRGYLWIGLNKGAFLYDSKNHKLIQYYSTIDYVTDIEEIVDGRIVICTKNGNLYCFSNEGKLVDTIYSNHSYTCLTFAPDGVIWLGTAEGAVYKYDLVLKETQDYSKICGMNGDQVNQILADSYGHIWIDTNRKITEFNPRNNSFRNFYTNDKSIKLQRFLPTAACRMNDGKICFGGIPGLFMITPSNSLDFPLSHAKTTITDICLDNQSILIHSNKSNNSKKIIKLLPKDRNLEIFFSSLNHSNASKIRYAYRLLGMDSKWTYGEMGKNSAYYHSLPKGTYTFEVKATDENGLWSNEVTSLTIIREPAFYETWWAYLFYFIVIIGLFYLYLRRVEKRHNEMWNDSQEMMNMRTYLVSSANLSDPEYIELDKQMLLKATKVVEANLSDSNFDVNALAAGVCMSRSTLARKLKAITGKTPLEFIRNIKMQHARLLLEDANRSVTEVASSLGYYNRKYFTSCFKDEFGITPSEFQKNNHK